MSDRDYSAADTRRLLCLTEALMLVPPAETTLRCATAEPDIELRRGRTVVGQCASLQGMTVGDSTGHQRDQLARLVRWREADYDARRAARARELALANGSVLSAGGT